MTLLAKDATLTDDTFLNGQILAWQPKDGYRAAIDSVLLAASVPAKAGEAVMEMGVGSGIASLCLAHRLRTSDGGPPHITGIEVQVDLARIAVENTARNDLSGFITIVEGDLARLPSSIQESTFDHVFANPPYSDAQKHIPPSNQERAGAHSAPNGLIDQWIKTALRHLRHKGTLTFIHKPEGLPQIIEALGHQAGGLHLFPLWAGSRKPAKRIILRAVKGSRAPLILHAGLILHDDMGKFTNEAERVLRDGAALPIK